MASAELSRRVEKVVGYPPLVDLGADQRREARMQVLAVGVGSQDDVYVLLRLVVASDISQHVLFCLRGLSCGLPESSG